MKFTWKRRVAAFGMLAIIVAASALGGVTAVQNSAAPASGCDSDRYRAQASDVADARDQIVAEAQALEDAPMAEAKATDEDGTSVAVRATTHDLIAAEVAIVTDRGQLPAVDMCDTVVGDAPASLELSAEQLAALAPLGITANDRLLVQVDEDGNPVAATNGDDHVVFPMPVIEAKPDPSDVAEA